ncbi:hypothetical protein Y032_0483g2301 [Ancylostoma ceylanicum]|uniref:Uncharacterized protein n=1 Tax=Ancylostoma ceylanicum TaxID=53326 RepID=A0A016WV76_9BILA|nr:hypothetical protein Y032_0483g2301 [Ancylostoma ceylanicum]
MQRRKNSYRVGPRARAVEHGSYLCKSTCVPPDTPCQKRKVVNVLIFPRGFIPLPLEMDLVENLLTT